MYLLNRKLVNLGYSFKTSSDTELFCWLDGVMSVWKDYWNVFVLYI